MSDPRTITVDPVQARVEVENACNALGLPFRDRFTGSEAAELLRRLYFDCTPGTPAEFKRKGYFVCVDPDALTPVEVNALAKAMHRRRRWLPTPSPHDLCKSPARLQVEVLRNAEQETFTDLDDFTLEDMLLQLTTTENPTLREAVYEGIREKLNRLGFVEE